MKKLLSVLLTITIAVPAMAAKTEEISGKPAESGEVVAIVRNADGSTTVVSKAVEIGEDGTANVVLEKGIDPAETPVELVATTPSGTITAQAPTKGDEVLADSKTTLANSLVNSMIAQFEEEVGYDLDPKQREKMLIEGKKFFEKLPTDGIETVDDLMSLAADYSSLHPDGPMQAIQKAGIPVPAEEALIASTLANKAFRPDEGSYDPLGIPPRMLDDGEDYPSNMAMGLLPDHMLPKYLRGEEGRKRMQERFGDHVALPGDYMAEIPEGAVAFNKPFNFNPKREMPPKFMPPPLFAFTEFDRFPEDMSGMQLPGSVVLPETAMAKMKEMAELRGGQLPKLPPNMPFAEGDFEAYGFPRNEDYDPSKMNFMPPPGAAEGSDGSAFVPKGFDPRDFIAEFNMDKVNTSPSKFEHLFQHHEDDLFPPPPPGFDFGHMAGIPRDFPFEDFGHEPPEGFKKMEFVHHEDFRDKYGDDFQPEIGDMFGGFDPRKDHHIPDGQFDDLFEGNETFAGMDHDAMKSHFDSLSPEEQEALMSGAFEHEPPPKPPADDIFGDFHNDGNYDDVEVVDAHPGDDGFTSTGEFDDDGIIGDGFPDDGIHGDCIAAADCLDDPNKDDQGEWIDGGNLPKDDGAVHHEPPPQDDGAVHHEPPPQDDGAVHHEPLPQDDGQKLIAKSSLKTRRANTNKIKVLRYRGSKKRSSSTLEDEAGVATVLTANTEGKVAKITGSKGVYQIGKSRARKKKAVVPFIVDPSTSKDSVKVNLSLKDGQVDNITVNLDKDSVEEVVTKLDGKQINMTITDELDITEATAYLLPPGSSTSKLQKAIKVKGDVVAGTKGKIVQLKIPNKKFNSLDAGVYTVVFENEGTSYYGKVTIGTLESKTLKVKIYVPSSD